MASAVPLCARDRAGFEGAANVHPECIGDNISWFICSGMSGIEVLTEQADIITIISKRAHMTAVAMGVAEPETAADHDARILNSLRTLQKMIPLSSHITIQYPTDRYSILPLVAVTYTTEDVRCVHHLSSGEAEKLSRALAESGHTCVIEHSDEKEGGADSVLSHFVSGSFELGELLLHVFLFYHQILSRDELNAIAAMDDLFGYSTKAKMALKQCTALYRHEVMGNAMHFEGLRRTGAEQYRLCLGS